MNLCVLQQDHKYEVVQMPLFHFDPP